MSDKEWEKLFELISKAILPKPGVSAGENGGVIRRKAVANSAEGDLDEFVNQVYLDSEE